MTNRNTIHSPGFVLLDLLTAVSIAGIVIMLGFSLYGSITRTFARQSRLTADLGSTVIVQKHIEHAVDNISTVTRCVKREIIGINRSTGKPVTLKFTGSALLNEMDTVTGQLKRFSFSLKENRRDPGDRDVVLLWDGLLTNGRWVGGTAAVKK